jgi:hypothetical protein
MVNVLMQRNEPVKRIKCEYCNQTNDENTALRCAGCGAGLPVKYVPELPKYKGRGGRIATVSTALPSIMYNTT